MPTTDTTAKTSKPRINRTPAQKAQDLLDQAKARYERAKTVKDRAGRDLLDAQVVDEKATAEVDASRAAVRYAEQHPDLTKASGATVEELKAKLATDPVTA